MVLLPAITLFNRLTLLKQVVWSVLTGWRREISRYTAPSVCLNIWPVKEMRKFLWNPCLASCFLITHWHFVGMCLSSCECQSFDLLATNLDTCPSRLRLVYPSFHQSVRPPAWDNSASTVRILFVKFCWRFNVSMSTGFNFLLKFYISNRYCTWREAWIYDFFG